MVGRTPARLEVRLELTVGLIAFRAQVPTFPESSASSLAGIVDFDEDPFFRIVPKVPSTGISLLQVEDFNFCSPLPTRPSREGASGA